MDIGGIVEERHRRLPDRVRERIKARVKERGLTQQEVAERLGVDPSWVSRKLSGKSPMVLGELDRFAEVLATEVVGLLQTETEFTKSAGEIPLITQDILSSVSPRILADVIGTWQGPRVAVPQRDGHLFAYRISDPGLETAPPGALLVVDPTATEFRPGGTYLIRREGRVMARIARGEGRWRRFESDLRNERQSEPIFVEDTPETHILGRVRRAYVDL
jgi:transcriptional regulator with XRE-family HTH domain